MFYCYILYSEKLDRFYKGHTNNLEDRLHRHNAASEKATQDGVPWRLCWATAKDSRSEAFILEQKLKNLSRDRLLRFMLKYAEGIGSPDELLFLKQLSGC